MIDWLEMVRSLKLQGVGEAEGSRLAEPLRALEQEFGRAAATVTDDVPLALTFDPAPEGDGR